MSFGFLFSLFVHILIGLLLFVSVPSWQKDPQMNESVPLWIDLKNVEIADKTNLPQKQEKKSAVQQTKKVVATQSVRQFEEVKPVQKIEKIPDSVQAVTQTDKKEKQPVKIKRKPDAPAVKTAPKVKSKPARDEGDLESLLASVEKMSVSTPSKKAPKEDVSEMVSGVLDGFKGGSGFGNGDKPTVSQVDFIAATVRKYWNFDAGIDGIENMVVVMEVALNPDGRVAWAKIQDSARVEQDASFRSVAESAKRAIYICDKLGDESPFRLLAQKYPASYREWQRMRLRFNPLDGGIS